MAIFLLTQRSMQGFFRDIYSNLARYLLKQLPNAPSKYDMNYVRGYYNNIEITGVPMFV